MRVAPLLLLVGCSSPGRSPSTPVVAPPSDARTVEHADAAPPADAATAVDLRNACSIRSRDACDALANRCDGGDKQSCVELGNAYRLGLGMDMDFAKARELFARVCKRPSGPFDGCVELAEIDCHSEDRSVKSAALATLEDACDGKFGPACAYAGLIYTEGLCAVPYNAGAWMYGAKLYQRGCDLGDVGACTHLGLLYRAGWGVKKDEERGKLLLFDACRRGDTAACEYVKAP